MSATKYDRPRGIAFGVSRTFEQVALPWLKNGKRSLSGSDAEFVCMVCQVPETLVNPSFQEQGYQCAERFADLLRAKPADTGQLIRLVSVWRERQLKTKRGRIRKAIELAMTRNRDETLSYQLIGRMAKEARIKFKDVSKMDVRGSIAAIRQEVKKQNIEAKKWAPRILNAVSPVMRDRAGNSAKGPVDK